VSTSGGRNHADERMFIFLRLPGVRREVETKDGRLLCVLQLRICALPANADRCGVLRLEAEWIFRHDEKL
jgi:hypothetical protein